MRKTILLLCFVWAGDHPSAQNTTTKLIDGARTLVELVKIVKPQAYNNTVVSSNDILFSNKTVNTVEVLLFRRKNDTAYVAVPSQLTITPQGSESYIDMQEGIYRYRVIIPSGTNNKEILKEGEFRLLISEKKTIIIQRS